MKDLVWLRPDGQEMTDEDWHQPAAYTLGLFLAGVLTEQDERGRQLRDANFLVLLNAKADPVSFVLPKFNNGDAAWAVEVDTDNTASHGHHASAEAYSLAGRSLVLLRQAGS